MAAFQASDMWESRSSERLSNVGISGSTLTYRTLRVSSLQQTKAKKENAWLERYEKTFPFSHEKQRIVERRSLRNFRFSASLLVEHTQHNKSCNNNDLSLLYMCSVLSSVFVVHILISSFVFPAFLIIFFKFLYSMCFHRSLGYEVEKLLRISFFVFLFKSFAQCVSTTVHTKTLMEIKYYTMGALLMAFGELKKIYIKD